MLPKECKIGDIVYENSSIHYRYKVISLPNKKGEVKVIPLRIVPNYKNDKLEYIQEEVKDLVVKLNIKNLILYKDEFKVIGEKVQEKINESKSLLE